MSHKRVDDFMKVVRERVTGQGINMAAWEHMYTRLRSILGESEEGIYLVASWSTWRRETTLAKWDCDFTEMVIDEAGVKERANADKKLFLQGSGLVANNQGVPLQGQSHMTAQQYRQQMASQGGLLNTSIFTPQK